jgi:predicted permease
MKFNPIVYFKLGFDAFSWFGMNVLLDSYWAQHIAEPGLIGFVFFASFVLLAFAYVARRFVLDGARSHFFVALGCASFGATLLISVTSPAFEDPGLMWIPALLFGAGFREAILAGQGGGRAHV